MHNTRERMGQGRRPPDPVGDEVTVLRVVARSRSGTWSDVVAGCLDSGVAAAEVERIFDLFEQREWVKATRHASKPPDSRYARQDVVRLTGAGESALRRADATEQFNIRLPRRVRDDLASLVSEADPTVTGIAVRALDEWARMQRFPGIEFRTKPSGRKPFLTGSRLSVWDVYRIWLAFDRDLNAMLEDYSHLRRGQVEVALAYARKYLHEMPSDDPGPLPPFVKVIEI